MTAMNLHFGVISLGQSIPLRGKSKLAVGMPAEQRDHLLGVETIMKAWLDEKNDELEKITQGRHIEVVIDAQVGGSHGRPLSELGVKFYQLEPDGERTPMQVRWQTLSGGPTIGRPFESWAREFLTPERKHVFNRLVKAVKMAISNLGTHSPVYEDR